MCAADSAKSVRHPSQTSAVAWLPDGSQVFADSLRHSQLVPDRLVCGSSAQVESTQLRSLNDSHPFLDRTVSLRVRWWC
jgi:hypothetical protein